MLVTLYSKPDCPLCDEVKRDLVDLQRRATFVLAERNILEEPADFARFRYLIPVVDVEGGPLLTPPHDWSTLAKAVGAVQGMGDEFGPR